MATAVIPKSEIRRNDNIRVGYGEVPAFDCEETGQVKWGFLGGMTTSNPKQARFWASMLDDEIRRTMKSPEQLLTAA